MEEVKQNFTSEANNNSGSVVKLTEDTKGVKQNFTSNTGGVKQDFTTSLLKSTPPSDAKEHKNNNIDC
jgi:hypothetical protein